jgi:TRAP-type mannitol/chloroaromatic compound transport system substrate-binding protein
MGGWFRRRVDSAADLDGLKMRIPGMGGQVMSRLGVTVQVLAGGDIFPALERGAIDATEWVGPYDDEKLGFHKVAKLYYYPGWWEPGPALSFLVNRQAWQRLPEEYQRAFEVACIDASVHMQTAYDFKNPPALKRLLSAGVTLEPFPEDVMERAQKATQDLVEELAAKEASFRKVYASWKSVRDDMFRWFGTAELEYQRFAFGRARG